MIVPLNKGKRDMTECGYFKDDSLLSMVGKIYVGILVDRVRKVTKRLVVHEQENFRGGRGVVGRW